MAGELSPRWLRIGRRSSCPWPLRNGARAGPAGNCHGITLAGALGFGLSFARHTRDAGGQAAAAVTRGHRQSSCAHAAAWVCHAAWRRHPHRQASLQKVFPTGPVYLMSLLHRASPRSPWGCSIWRSFRRAGAGPPCGTPFTSSSPTSWLFPGGTCRSFSPQDMDGGLRDAFVFFHDPSPARKAAAAFRGLADMLSYN